MKLRSSNIIVQLELYISHYDLEIVFPAALMPIEEAIKMLKEEDLEVYGDGRYPIGDYLFSLCPDKLIRFADYIQVLRILYQHSYRY